jgi:hypothetical protein
MQLQHHSIRKSGIQTWQKFSIGIAADRVHEGVAGQGSVSTLFIGTVFRCAILTWIPATQTARQVLGGWKIFFSPMGKGVKGGVWGE